MKRFAVKDAMRERQTERAGQYPEASASVLEVTVC